MIKKKGLSLLVVLWIIATLYFAFDFYSNVKKVDSPTKTTTTAEEKATQNLRPPKEETFEDFEAKVMEHKEKSRKSFEEKRRAFEEASARFEEHRADWEARNGRR